MPYREDRDGLTAWYKASTIFRPELGRELPAGALAIPDLGGSGYALQSTTAGSAAPRILAGGPNARPFLDLDGVSNAFTGYNTGVRLSSLVTAAGATLIVVAKVDTLGTPLATLLASDQAQGLGAFLRVESGQPMLRAFNVSGGVSNPAVLPFTLGQWHIFACVHRAAYIRAYVDTPDVSTATASGNTQNLAGFLALGGGGNGAPAFLDGQVVEVLSYNVGKADTDLARIFAYLAAEYFSRDVGNLLTHGAASEQMRDLASRKGWRDRSPRKTVTLDLPLHAIDTEMLDDVALAHPLGLDPEGKGKGWGDSVTSRRTVRVIEQVPNWKTKTVKTTFADLRDYLHNYQETARAKRVSSPLRLGVMSSGRAPVRRFYRGSKAWVEDPSSGLVTEVPVGFEKVTSRGLLLERAARNVLLRSAFVAGTTGLTIQKGSGSIDLDTSPPFLFDTTVQATQQSLKLTAGSPNTVGPKVIWPITGDVSVYLNNPTSYGWLTIDHVDDGGVPLRYRLKALAGTNAVYWDATAEAWTSSNIENLVSLSNSRAPRRFAARLRGPAMGSYTLTLEVFQESGGVPGRINHIHCAEIQVPFPGASLRSPTSRIVTNTAEAARDPDILCIDDESEVGVVNAEQGTLRFRFAPLWSGADVAASETIVIATIGEYAQGTYWQIRFRDGHLEWLNVNGGVTTLARIPFSPVAGETHDLAVRWTGAHGELGLAPGTISILINGVRGEDATMPSLPSGFEHHLHWGNTPAVANPYDSARISVPDGYIECVESLPFVLSDAEVLARTWR